MKRCMTREKTRGTKNDMFRLRERFLLLGLSLSCLLLGQPSFAKDPKIVDKGITQLGDNNYSFELDDGTFITATAPSGCSDLRSASIRGNKLLWICPEGPFQSDLPERKQPQDASSAKKSKKNGSKPAKTDVAGSQADRDKKVSDEVFGEGIKEEGDDIKTAGAVKTKAEEGPDDIYTTPDKDPKKSKTKPTKKPGQKPEEKKGFDWNRWIVKGGMVGAAAGAAAYFGLGPAGLGLLGTGAAIGVGLGAFAGAYLLATLFPEMLDGMKPVAILGIVGAALGVGLYAAIASGTGAAITFSGILGGAMTGGLIGLGIGLFAMVIAWLKSK